MAMTLVLCLLEMYIIEETLASGDPNPSVWGPRGGDCEPFGSFKLPQPMHNKFCAAYDNKKWYHHVSLIVLFCSGFIGWSPPP